MSSMVKAALNDLQDLVQSCFDEFDRIQRVDEIVSVSESRCDIKTLTINVNERKWGQLNQSGLPQFTSKPFVSNKETLAHAELSSEKDATGKIEF